MRVLFITHRTPFPPNKGEKIRAYHLLDEMAKRHVVSLIYWLDDPNDSKHIDVLRKLCHGSVVAIRLNGILAMLRGIKSLLLGRSFSEGYFYSIEFQTHVDRLIKEEQPDIVFAFSSAMGGFLRGVPQHRTIVDYVDVDSEKWRQLAELKSFPFSFLCRLEQRRFAKFEQKISGLARWNLFVSNAEAEVFKKSLSKGAVAVLPNGVDAEVRRLPVRKTDRTCNDRTIDPKIVFVGTMNYYPNTDAVRYFVGEVWPAIRRRYGSATFDIVGRCPPRQIRRLDGFEGIRVLGEVANVVPYLLRADISIAPMRSGRGVQNKVLEAMAIGVPVVASSEAIKGIQVERGEEILIGDDPESFAGQVIRLVREPELYHRIISRARSRVVDYYSWQSVGVQLNELLKSLVECSSVDMVRVQPR